MLFIYPFSGEGDSSRMAALLAACLALRWPLTPESKDADGGDTHGALGVVQAAVMPGDENSDSVQMPIGQQMVASSSFRKARSNPHGRSAAISIRRSEQNARQRRPIE